MLSRLACVGPRFGRTQIRRIVVFNQRRYASFESTSVWETPQYRAARLRHDKGPMYSGEAGNAALFKYSDDVTPYDEYKLPSDKEGYNFYGVELFVPRRKPWELSRMERQAKRKREEVKEHKEEDLSAIPEEERNIHVEVYFADRIVNNEQEFVEVIGKTPLEVFRFHDPAEFPLLWPHRILNFVSMNYNKFTGPYLLHDDLHRVQFKKAEYVQGSEKVVKQELDAKPEYTLLMRHFKKKEFEEPKTKLWELPDKTELMKAYRKDWEEKEEERRKREGLPPPVPEPPRRKRKTKRQQEAEAAAAAAAAAAAKTDAAPPSTSADSPAAAATADAAAAVTSSDATPPTAESDADKK